MTGIVAHTYPEWWLKLTGQAAHLSTDYSVLDVIYEYGVSAVSEALCRLEKLSPFEMSADKVSLICAKKEESLKQTNIKTDRLSEKSKTTLSQYDRLRSIQNKAERKVV